MILSYNSLKSFKMIEYNYPLYRPPAEANSLIIQVTLGCSHNSCTFCSMYVSKKYKKRNLNEIEKEIKSLATMYPETRRVFLADGDAMTLNTEELLDILEILNSNFSKLSRVSIYASANNLLQKSVDELKKLKEKKLSLLYFGMESGNDTLLKKIKNGAGHEEIIEALNKASEAGFKTSVTVILGLGGLEHSIEHIEDSAKLVNKVEITYLSTLQLGLDESIKKRFLKPFDSFTALNDLQMLEEQERFIKALNPSNNVIFRSNHASNALPLKGTLPKDKEKLLDQIEYAKKFSEELLIPKIFRSF